MNQLSFGNFGHFVGSLANSVATKSVFFGHFSIYNLFGLVATFSRKPKWPSAEQVS